MPKKSGYVTHEYNGETFKVQSGLSQSAADSFCRNLAMASASRKGNPNPAFEVERMPEDYRAPNTPKRGRGRPKGSGKGNPSPAIPKALTAMLTLPTADATPADDFYSQGFYRIPCATCGKGILRTGGRGRAPKYHSECRPSE